MHFQSLVVTSLRRTAYFDLAFASAYLLGVVTGEAYPPVKFYLPYGAVGIRPLCLFCFTSCIPNNLAFWKNLEEYALILRIPLSVF